ncbi:MAG: hypothetical protein SVK08_01065 [Halobacteriota archaeon]|nr:hypothetical protein [Halobacteriota archaeon]
MRTIEGLNEEESAWVCRAVQTNAMGKSIDFEKDPAPSECAIEEFLRVSQDRCRIDKHQKE